MSFVKIGIGGPVGSGKTALIERLTRRMSKEYSICVITNDIYTREDAEFLIKNSCLQRSVRTWRMRLFTSLMWRRARKFHARAVRA